MLNLLLAIEKVFLYGKRTKFGTYEVAVQVPDCLHPKGKEKVIYGQYREEIGRILRQLCSYNGVEILEGHIMLDKLTIKV